METLYLYTPSHTHAHHHTITHTHTHMHTTPSYTHMHTITPHTSTHTIAGTVIDPAEISVTILKFQQSREYKSDKRGYVNMPVGKVSIM